jgi:hypothetical protein
MPPATKNAKPDFDYQPNVDQRHAIRVLTRAFGDIPPTCFDEQHINFCIRTSGKISTHFKNLHKNAPNKWPIDLLAVSPRFLDHCAEATNNNLADFEINAPADESNELIESLHNCVRILAYQEIINSRKRGTLVPRVRKTTARHSRK